MENDLISRQAAVAAVAKGLKRTFVEYRDVAEKMLNNVSSAQTEQTKIIRCKDCMYMITHEGYGYLGEPAYTCKGNMEGWVLPDSFCSFAERKEVD